MIRSWQDILHHYEKVNTDISSVKGIHDLVTYIINNNLSQTLYAWTSMFDLCIVQTPVTYPYNGPLLRVKPLSNDVLQFQYEDTNIRERQWHREVPYTETVLQFKKFIAQLGWLIEVKQ